MKKISVLAATLLGAAVLCAAPISLHLSSLSVDKAQAYVPAGTSCKTAAKLEVPTGRKARHAFRHECKAAWKAQKKGA